MDIASRIRSGMTSVNSVISFAAIPSLPFGGVGDSGFGRIHGEDGLKEFTYAKAVARQKYKPAMALTTFRRNGEGVATPVWLVPDGAEGLAVWTPAGSGRVSGSVTASGTKPSAWDRSRSGPRSS